MNDNAYFIKDRALTLVGDAKIHRATAPVALIWLRRAGSWAERHGQTELADELKARARCVEELHVPAQL
jgi:hypothetical protein